jgi:hypothetical protein
MACKKNVSDGCHLRWEVIKKVIEKFILMSVSLILSIIAVAGIGIASASPTISITPASIKGLNQGDTFSLDVKVDPEGQPVRVVEINLKFDPAIVQIDGSNSILCDIGASKYSIAIGDFLGYNSMELLNDIDNTTGTLHLSHVVASRRPEVTAPGTYATLNFKVNSNAPARQSIFDLTTAKLSNANGYIPGVTANNGTITIAHISSSASQAVSAVMTTSAPNMPGFSAPLVLIAVVGFILCNLRRKNR